MSAMETPSDGTCWYIGGGAWQDLTNRAVPKLGLPHEGAPADAFEDFGLDRSATAATDRRPLGEALPAAAEGLHHEVSQDERHDRRLRLCGHLDDLIGKLHLEPATASPANPDAPK